MGSAKGFRESESKHNVGFWEASTVFNDALSITIPDADHADEEELFVIIGMSSTRNLLVVDILLEESRSV